MEAKQIDARRIKIDGGYLCDYKTIEEEARRQARHGYRFWQAFWNITYAQGQTGWREPWPELFYKEHFYEGLAEFNKYFEVIDGYIVPR